MDGYAYKVYLDDELITQSNYEYESEGEAESEGCFAVNCYADSMDRHWSEFRVETDCCF